MKKQISHIGTVVSAEEGRVTVHIGRRSACSSCAVSATCSTAEQKDIVVVARLVPGIAVVHPGDTIVISETRGKALTSALVGYGLPLLLFVAVCFGTISCGLSDEMSALSALAALPVYYAALWLMRDRLSQMFMPVAAMHAGDNIAEDEICQMTLSDNGSCDNAYENNFDK